MISLLHGLVRKQLDNYNYKSFGLVIVMLCNEQSKLYTTVNIICDRSIDHVMIKGVTVLRWFGHVLAVLPVRREFGCPSLLYI